MDRGYVEYRVTERGRRVRVYSLTSLGETVCRIRMLSSGLLCGDYRMFLEDGEVRRVPGIHEDDRTPPDWGG